MTHQTNLPVVFGSYKAEVVSVDATERGLVSRAAELFKLGYFDHALVDIWNAAVNNLRRRVEAYSVELWVSVTKDEGGRRKFNKDGDTLSERWSGVDDLVLISGATKLGILNKKAGKSLEMINWMRNHASSAHVSDVSVGQEEVIALAIMIEKNLLSVEMPEQAHSIADLFDPVKGAQLDTSRLSLFKEQIRGYRTQDIRVCFGFMLDLLCKGGEPALSNVRALFPVVWERAPDELRKTVGMRYHTVIADPAADDSSDKGARSRLLDFLTEVGGVAYVPEGVRANLYRIAARKLAEAKNTSYGWSQEEDAARTLVQFGTNVPTSCFEEVYQEILAVWCGNYWGRSGAATILSAFIEALPTDKLLRVSRMFRDNERVKSELFQPRPSAHAIALLESIRSRMTLSGHIGELDSIIASVHAL